MKIVLIMLGIYLLLIVAVIILYYLRVYKPVDKKEQRGKDSIDFTKDVRNL